jgi:hypothetical protein
MARILAQARPIPTSIISICKDVDNYNGYKAKSPAITFIECVIVCW